MNKGWFLDSDTKKRESILFDSRMTIQYKPENQLPSGFRVYCRSLPGLKRRLRLCPQLGGLIIRGTLYTFVITGRSRPVGADNGRK